MPRPLLRPEPLAAPRAVLRLQGRRTRYGTPTIPGVALLLFVICEGVGGFLLATALGRLRGGLPPNAPRGILLAFGALLVFCGAAFGLQAARRYALGQRAQRLRGEYPDQPWRWERTWSSELKDDGSAELAQAWLVPAVFGLFMIPFHWIGLTQKGAGVMLAAALLFDLFLLALVGKAVYLLLRYLRLGTSRLSLERVPCMLGESLEATLRPARPLSGVQSVELTLRCVEERAEVQRSGNKRQHAVVHYALHTQSQTVEAAALAEGRPLSFALPLPSDAAELATCLSAEAPRYWELECRAARPGVDYRAVFLVPVYG
ncbi:hypothetical protein FGE12_22535 [Aggregicoccus sp. 17bor-14]|uniref:hypothetical protein n=1 Tax=Myxococcaceae TaxID=31 RepID=UPI00129C57DC|nr:MULTISPECIES: hypothetical protein [Myxococcaceae]MBF5045199.1 hypothetical protein [Simulacricoccus sp. 17bor-14]MRI90940.1 hypothetical protein [Aggregicoccus sp. 17bor-14]